MDKLHYKDFATGKPKWTRGRFLHWTEKAGPLGVRYAAVGRDRSMLFIPEYCLTPEARRSIAYEVKCRETPERVRADCPKMTAPAVPRKHLFGIVARRGKRHGYFLVATPDRCITREALREMFVEAKEEGLDKPLHIYCACAAINGPGMDILQIECDSGAT